MPTVLTFRGHRFFFYSNENKEPPHIHVENAENYAKFWLDPVKVVDWSGYNAPEIRELQKLIEANRTLMLKEWNDFFESI